MCLTAEKGDILYALVQGCDLGFEIVTLVLGQKVLKIATPYTRTNNNNNNK